MLSARPVVIGMEGENSGSQSWVRETKKMTRDKPAVNMVKVQKAQRVGVFRYVQNRQQI